MHACRTSTQVACACSSVFFCVEYAKYIFAYFVGSTLSLLLADLILQFFRRRYWTSCCRAPKYRRSRGIRRISFLRRTEMSFDNISGFPSALPGVFDAFYYAFQAFVPFRHVLLRVLGFCLSEASCQALYGFVVSKLAAKSFWIMYSRGFSAKRCSRHTGIEPLWTTVRGAAATVERNNRGGTRWCSFLPRPEQSDATPYFKETFCCDAIFGTKRFSISFFCFVHVSGCCCYRWHRSRPDL